MKLRYNFLNENPDAFLSIFKASTSSVWTENQVISVNGKKMTLPCHMIRFQRSSKKNPGFDILLFETSPNDKLGSDSDAEVYRALKVATPNYQETAFTWRKKQSVIKIIRKIPSESPEAFKKRTLSEYVFCAMAGHLGVKKPVFNASKDTCYLIMKQMKGKKLDYYIKNLLPEHVKSIISIKLLEALRDQVSNKGIIHQDLKPENIIVTLFPEVEVNIIDYGYSKFFGQFDYFESGNLLYAPPEHFHLLLNQKTKSSDLFSMARIIAQLWVTDNGLYEDSESDVDKNWEKSKLYAFNAQKKLSIPQYPALEIPLKQMLSINKEQRPDIHNAIDHLKEAISNPDMKTCIPDENVEKKISISGFLIQELYAQSAKLNHPAIMITSIAASLALGWPLSVTFPGSYALTGIGLFAYKAYEAYKETPSEIEEFIADPP